MGILKSKIRPWILQQIINYCIINKYYNCIINAYYNYYISNEGPLEESNKEENVGVAGGVTTSCLKRRL
jgi:hypothetical protein